MNPAWTYTTILEALQKWPVNTNPAYVADCPRLIGLGELRVVRDLNLEIFETTGTTPTVAGSRLVAKPADMVTPRSLQITVGNTMFAPLKQRSYAMVNATYPSLAVADQARPDTYAELNETDWWVGPTPDIIYTITVRYVARPAGLTPSAPTSWLGTNVPDALFAACLMEAEHYLKADDRYADWRQKYQELLVSSSNELVRLKRSGELSPYRSAEQAVPSKAKE